MANFDKNQTGLYYRRMGMLDTYRLSFTFGGLLLPETIAIAKRYQQSSDWESIRLEVLEGSVLRKTRESSRYRYFREIRNRLAQAHSFEREAAAIGAESSKYAVFAICSRHYALLGDFVQEVLLEKASYGQKLLGQDDYYHFIEGKKLVHPELNALTPATETKIRQVVFRMLMEGGLLSRGHDRTILVPVLPDDLKIRYIEAGDYTALTHLLQQGRVQ